MIVETNTTTPDAIYQLIDDLKNHFNVIRAADELGYGELALKARLSAKEVLEVIRQTFSVHLFDSVLHSHQIAARRFRRVAGGIVGKVCLMYSKQKAVLLAQTCD